MLEGVILEVVPQGLVYVEEPQSKKRYVFTFGKIRDYRGESARELGLRVGTRLRFSTTGELVDEVELIEPAHRRTPKRVLTQATSATG